MSNKTTIQLKGKALCLELIRTLKMELIPIEGHSDPGAINDVWEWLEDEIKSLYNPPHEPGEENDIFEDKGRQVVKKASEIVLRDEPNSMIETEFGTNNSIINHIV